MHDHARRHRPDRLRQPTGRLAAPAANAQRLHRQRLPPHPATRTDHRHHLPTRLHTNKPNDVHTRHSNTSANSDGEPNVPTWRYRHLSDVHADRWNSNALTITNAAVVRTVVDL
jgi:hypothetical protein